MAVMTRWSHLGGAASLVSGSPIFGIIEKCFIGCPPVKRKAVGAIGEFDEVGQRRLVLNADFNAGSE